MPARPVVVQAPAECWRYTLPPPELVFHRHHHSLAPNSCARTLTERLEIRPTKSSLVQTGRESSQLPRGSTHVPLLHRLRPKLPRAHHGGRSEPDNGGVRNRLHWRVKRRIEGCSRGWYCRASRPRRGSQPAATILCWGNATHVPRVAHNRCATPLPCQCIMRWRCRAMARRSVRMMRPVWPCRSPGSASGSSRERSPLMMRATRAIMEPKWNGASP